MTPARAFSRLGAIALGIAAGAGMSLAATNVLEGRPETARRPAARVPRQPFTEPSPDAYRPARSRRLTLLVWSPMGLPAGLEGLIHAVPGVRAVTRAHAQLDWITRVESPDGAELYRGWHGWRIPMEVVGVRPRQYARFVPPSDRSAVLSLADGGMLLAKTAAALRGGTEGLEVTTVARRATVVGVVGDETSGGYEAMIPARNLAKGHRRDDFLLVLLRSMDRRGAVEEAIRGQSSLGPVRTRLQGESPYLRYGDAVLPQMIVKHYFGEFTARSGGNGTIEVDPAWSRRNLVTRDVPVLGSVTCHQRIMSQLVAAMRQIVDDALSFTIDPAQYAGCYGARFVNADPDGRLSHHAWGIALDINAVANPYGARPHQDMRLVRIMEAHGFTWGGRWLVPDGMHFEWARPGT